MPNKTKKRKCYVTDANTEAKLKQYIELCLKDYPLHCYSQAIRDLVDIGMKTVLKVN